MKFSQTPSYMILTVRARKRPDGSSASARARRSQEPVELVQAAPALEPERGRHPPGELPARRRRQVRLEAVRHARVRPDDRLLPRRDAQAVQILLRHQDPGDLLLRDSAAGATRSTSIIAPSCSVPTGSPAASRSMRPSGGSGVSRGDARELERPRVRPRAVVIPVHQERPAGRAPSRRAARGWGCRPRTGRATTRPRGSTPHPDAPRHTPAMMRSYSSRAWLSDRSTRIRFSPPADACTCASWNPGSSSRPAQVHDLGARTRTPPGPRRPSPPPRSARRAPPPPAPRGCRRVDRVDAAADERQVRFAGHPSTSARAAARSRRGRRTDARSPRPARPDPGPRPPPRRARQPLGRDRLVVVDPRERDRRPQRVPERARRDVPRAPPVHQHRLAVPQRAHPGSDSCSDTSRRVARRRGARRQRLAPHEVAGLSRPPP